MPMVLNVHPGSKLEGLSTGERGVCDLNCPRRMCRAKIKSLNQISRAFPRLSDKIIQLDFVTDR